VDLSKLDTTVAAEEGAELQLRNPIDDSVLRDEKSGDPVVIMVVGTDSKEYMRVTHAIQNRRLGKRLGKGSRPKMTAEELEADALELLVASTKGWKHIVVDGAELAYSEKNVRTLYQRFPWIKEQVDEFIADRTNFLGE
jgi:hypothetical protein